MIICFPFDGLREQKAWIFPLCLYSILANSVTIYQGKNSTLGFYVIFLQIIIKANLS